MFGKSLILLGAAGTIGAWWAGALGAGSHERVADNSPAAVEAQKADAATCQKIFDDFAAGSELSGPSFAHVAKTSLQVAALQGKLKAAGCPTGFSNDGPGDFAPAKPDSDDSGQRADEVNFEMGKPMISVSGEGDSNSN